MSNADWLKRFRSLGRDEVQARSRRDDPITSYLAAADVESSGSADKQRVLCLKEVVRLPGQTAAEIAVGCNLERHAPSRRLPELRDAGLLRNGESRECRVMQRQSMTWWTVEDADTVEKGELF